MGVPGNPVAEAENVTLSPTKVEALTGCELKITGGLTVSTGQANSLTVANVREVHVGSGPNADAVKKMVILTYH